MTQSSAPIISPPRSLRSRLTILIGLLAVLPALLLVGLGLVAFHNHVLPERRTYLSELAGEYSKRMESLLDRRVEEVADIERLLSREQQQDLLEALQRELGGHTAFASLTIVGTDGRVLVSTNQATTGKTSSYADLAAEALESGAAIGTLADDATEGGLVVPMAVRATFATAQARSTLVGTLLWSDLFSVVHDGALTGDSGELRRFVVFIDSSARVLAAPGALLGMLSPLQVIPGLLSKDHGLEQLFEGKSLELGGVKYRVVAGEHHGDSNDNTCGIGRHCQIGSWPATAIMFEDVAIALAPVWRLFLRGILLLCLVILLSAVAARFFTKRITAQLDRLTRASAAIADGRSVEAVPVTSDDEIGTLTGHFNQMSVALAESKKILETHASELEDTNLKLRELDETRTRLLANVSHEMRTPIAAMISAARIIQRYHSDKPDTVPRFSKVIVEEGERLASLVNEALDLAALESRKAKWSDEAVDIGRLITDTVAGAKPLAQSRNIGIYCAIDDELPRLVADPEKLQQVIGHLLDNAINFTAGGGQITVRSSFGNDRLRIEVEDNGIGIAAGDLDKIFQAFHQVQNADQSREKPVGSGLGLAISRDIVRRYGGEIEVDSAPGRGSTFRVILPLDIASNAASDAASHPVVTTRKPS